MASLRRRNLPNSTKDDATVDSIEQLTEAVQKAKKSATEKGVSPTDFLKCLGTAAEKNQLVKEPKKQPEKKVVSSPTLWSRISFCYRVIVVLHLVSLLLFLLYLYSPTLSGFIMKYLHVKLYYIVRPIRMGIAAFAPFLTALTGKDAINTDCLIENPLIQEINSCPCLHIKFPKELVISDSMPTIPPELFDFPQHNVYIIRNALDTSQVKVEDFQDFKHNHPTHRGPKTCLKLTTNGNEGVQKMSELYNPELMKDYLNPKTPWAFTWEECPTEDRTQSFRELYPEPDYLPEDIELSETTVFTLSTQWANAAHSEASFEGASLMVAQVLVGEAKFVMETANPECYEYCTPFKGEIVLKAGDVLLFDQIHWGYMSWTWSKYAITSTMAVYPLAQVEATSDEGEASSGEGKASSGGEASSSKGEEANA